MNTPQSVLLKHSHRTLPEDRQLIDFTIREHIFEHQQYDHALSTIAEVHQHHRTHKRAAGLLLTAPAGFGKSVILNQYQGYFPKQQENQQTIIPVISLVLPSRPTDFSVATAALEALGYPASKKRENAADKTRKLFELFNRCKTEMILIDELHHLDKSRNSHEFYVAVNWIKNLISVGNVSVVAVGLPHAVQVIQLNRELHRRFVKTLSLTPFDLLDEESFLEFRSILKSINDLLPYETETPLHEQNLARRVLFATNGLIDYLCTLIDSTVFIAQFLMKPSIHLEVLATAFRESIWYSVPERRNPFHPQARLRPLTKSGEPFHLDQNKE